MNRKIIPLMLLVTLAACKEKKTVETNEYKPSRSDYIVAANHVYVLACDSAAKQTARAMQDSSSYTVNYTQDALSRFELFRSLGKQGLVVAFDNQIRDLLTESITDLHMPSSRFMSVGKNDYPSDFLARNIMTQKFLVPQIDSLSGIVKRSLDNLYDGSRAQTIWTQSNTLYNQYYSTSENPIFDFTPLARNAAFKYVQNVKIQEDSVKVNYRLWKNKQALTVMDYLNTH